MDIIEYINDLSSIRVIIGGISLLLVLIILSIVIFFKLKSANFYIKLLLENTDALTQNNLELINKQQRDQSVLIENLKRIEQLNSECYYLKKNLVENENNKEKNVELVKGALFELGNELSKQLIDKHRVETKESRELSERNIEITAQKFHNEFEKLVVTMGVLSKDFEDSRTSVDIIKTSLLSPAMCGRLAEITLENILKTSGLRAELDFITQYSFKDLNNLSHRPDAVVFLPFDHIMIIDAKASKFLFEEVAGENLAKTMNNHLKSLVAKEYTDNIFQNFKRNGKKISRISMLMFLPTEHAVEKISDSDTTFMDRAYKKNIYPIGPSGLINMLYLAKMQISEQLMLENHQIILNEIENVIKSISTLSEFSKKFGNNIQALANNYDKFASSFNKNFINKILNMQKLGVGVQKDYKFEKLTRYELISTSHVNSEEKIIDQELIES